MKKCVDSAFKFSWLSHILNEKTPLYGGGKGFDICSGKSISKGDSCNTSKFGFSSHTGTHVDVPRHFIQDGSTIDSYHPSEWMFNSPVLLDVPSKPGQLIGVDDLPCVDGNEKEVDLLLIRTGFEQFRSEDLYWENGCGLLPELAEYLCRQHPSLRAIGLDTISLTSYQNRALGRKAHYAFLSKNIRIFEDMSLKHIRGAFSLSKVIALPLLIAGGDGAPCTIVGWEKKHVPPHKI